MYSPCPCLLVYIASLSVTVTAIVGVGAGFRLTVSSKSWRVLCIALHPARESRVGLFFHFDILMKDDGGFADPHSTGSFRSIVNGRKEYLALTLTLSCGDDSDVQVNSMRVAVTDGGRRNACTGHESTSSPSRKQTASLLVSRPLKLLH